MGNKNIEFFYIIPTDNNDNISLRTKVLKGLIKSPNLHILLGDVNNDILKTQHLSLENYVRAISGLPLSKNNLNKKELKEIL